MASPALLLRYWYHLIGTLRESLNRKNQGQMVFGFANACRQDPAVSKNVLVEIAAKKQERGMLTKYNQCRDKRAKAAAKAQETGAPTRKRTKAEALAAGIGNRPPSTGRPFRPIPKCSWRSSAG